ncbi:hypothetical protein BKA70DRAFT_1234493 [Coprinopsis sp. MPI-PUGE-AT-0042]|nr:hypothetical protein BKA70DRAFT_1234493 [Coprinopsis sp. MPI-PUGE-AT-0042]
MPASATDSLSYKQFRQLEKEARRDTSSGLSFAHSTTFNPSALEHYSYGPWATFCYDVFGKSLKPFCIVAPQCPLGDKPLISGALESSVSTLPGKTKGRVFPDIVLATVALEHRSSKREVDSMEDMQPESTESDCEIVPETFEAQPNTNEKSHSDGNGSDASDSDEDDDDDGSDEPDWSLFRVSQAILSAVIEIKRPAGRHEVDPKKFAQNLRGKLDEAINDAEQQATRAFNTHPQLRRVIAIAISGKWWRWAVLTREYLSKINTPQSQENPPTAVGSREDEPRDEIEASRGAQITGSRRGSRDRAQTVQRMTAAYQRENASDSHGRLYDVADARVSYQASTSKRTKGSDKETRARKAAPFKIWKPSELQDLPESEGFIVETPLKKRPSLVLENVPVYHPGLLHPMKGRIWSNVLCLGDKASTQRLFLIYCLLKKDVMNRKTGVQETLFHVEEFDFDI